MRHDFDIGDYGACADGKTMNTIVIQKAINACHQAGGGRVLCGPGCYRTGSLELKSNVELHLMAGCRFVGSVRQDDYVDFTAKGFRLENAPESVSQSLIRAVNAENIAVTGPGEINGSGPAFYTLRDDGSLHREKVRPRMVMLYKCRNVRLEDTSFIDAACWTFWLMKCERVNIHRLKICGGHGIGNNDGIDIDACRDVTVSDCVIRTGDDCLVLRSISQVYDTPGICENVSVTNCILDSKCNGVRVGCPGDGVIRNCTFNNLVIHSDRNNGIIFENPGQYLPSDGKATADIHNILFSNVAIDCARWPIKIVVQPGIKLPRLSGLSFSDFRISSGEPCLVEGSPETIIRDVSFSNMIIKTSGEDAIICRHCQGVKLTNVELSNRPEAVTGSDKWRSPWMPEVLFSKLMPRKTDMTLVRCVRLSQALKWRKLVAEPLGDININQYYKSAHGIVYVGGKFKVTQSGLWQLSLGYDGGVRVFVDGKPVFCDPVLKNPAVPGRAKPEIRLSEGVHELMIAEDMAGGYGGFLFIRFEVPLSLRTKAKKAHFPQFLKII